MQTKPDILSILNSNQHQPMMPQSIRDSIANDSSSMISTMTRAGVDVNRITKSERKIYNDWLSVGKKEADDKRIKTYAQMINVCNGYRFFLGDHSRYTINQIIVARFMFLREYNALELLTLKDDIGEDNNDARVNSIRYQSYMYNLSLYGLTPDQIIDLLQSNPATKNKMRDKDIQTLMNDIRDDGFINGHDADEMAMMGLLSTLENTAFNVESVKKSFIKVLEGNLNTLLNVDSYKKLGGLQALSKAIERYYETYHGFERCSIVDRGIATIVYALMVLQAPWQAIMASCFMEWIETLADTETEKLNFITVAEKKEVQHELNLDSAVDAILNGKMPKKVEEYIELYESIVVFSGLVNRYSDSTSLINIDLRSHSSLNHIRKNIGASFNNEEWNAMTLEDQCFVIVQIILINNIRMASDAQKKWMPKDVEEFVGYAPDVDFSKKSPSKSKKKKSKTDRATKTMECLEKELTKVKEDKESMLSEIESLKRQLKNAKNEAKQLRAKTHELDKVIENAQNELHENDLKSEEREELNRLREYAFNISDNGQEVSESSSVPEAINEDVIRDAGEIVILGGHTTLCRKIVDKYPNVRWIDGRKRVPFDMIKNASHVFFLFDFMSHGTYYEGCKLCTANHVPFDYIQGTNLQRAEHQMIQALA